MPAYCIFEDHRIFSDRFANALPRTSYTTNHDTCSLTDDIPAHRLEPGVLAVPFSLQLHCATGHFLAPHYPVPGQALEKLHRLVLFRYGSRSLWAAGPRLLKAQLPGRACAYACACACACALLCLPCLALPAPPARHRSSPTNQGLVLTPAADTTNSPYLHPWIQEARESQVPRQTHLTSKTKPKRRFSLLGTQRGKLNFSFVLRSCLDVMATSRLQLDGAPQHGLAGDNGTPPSVQSCCSHLVWSGLVQTRSAKSALDIGQFQPPQRTTRF